MDLLDGTVVHAVAGEREKYEPIDSVLTDTSAPVSIAYEFEKLGFEELYIADLNAIQNKGENISSIDRLSSETEFDLLVDAGFKTSKEVKPYLGKGISKIIFATETLQSFDEVEKVVDGYSVPVIGSVDMKEGEVIANQFERRVTLAESIREFEDFGVSEIILLNLKRVGGSGGPDKSLLQKAVGLSDVPVIVGGGIRNLTDLQELKKLGAGGALTATAIHNGSIGSAHLEAL